MKIKVSKKTLLGILLSFSVTWSWAQSNQDLVNILIQQKIITKHMADSLKKSVTPNQNDTGSVLHPLLISQYLHLNGYTQIRYQEFASPLKNGGFDIHHARFLLNGPISPKVNYYIQSDFAGTSGYLLDAYGDIHISPIFNLIIGQQKIALSRENQEIDNMYDFIDRTQVINALCARLTDVIGNQNGRDIGIQAYGSFAFDNRSPIADYWIGVYNGAGINNTENNHFKDLAGRIIVHPLKIITIGGSFYRGEDVFETPAASHARNREGLEAKIELPQLYFQAEYLKGNDAVINRYGYYIETGIFLIPKKLIILGRLDAYDPNKSIIHDHSSIYLAGIDYTFSPNVRVQSGFNYWKYETGNPNGTPNNNYISLQLTVEF